MKKLLLIPGFLLLSGCGQMKEWLDIGSAKAIKEIQEKHNEHIPIIQNNAKNIRNLSKGLNEQHPKIHSYKRVLAESERNYERALLLTKATADPYSQIGVLIKWLEKLDWLLSPEGLAMIGSLLFGAGGAGLAFKQTRKVGKAVTQIKNVAKMNPDDVKESDLHV